MLKFIGSGGAFNRASGNNSAYLELGTELFIFDVGEDVLDKILKFHLFDNKSRIHIFITHLHGDHVGGLGTTIAYLYYKIFEMSNDNIRIYFPNESLNELLELQGITDKLYSNCNGYKGNVEVQGFGGTIEYLFEEVNHDHNLDYKGKTNTYCIEMNLGGKTNIFYSGDTNEFKEKLKNIGRYDYIYQEVTSNKNVAVHLDYDRLLQETKEFTKEDRKKIILMHLDQDFDINRACDDGFRVAESI